MRSAGITVRPIRQITGEAHFCEIFLTDVEIPVGNLIGAENDGWPVAQRTLNTERGATMIELAERLALGLRWLVRLARDSNPGSELVEDLAWPGWPTGASACACSPAGSPRSCQPSATTACRPRW